MSQGTDHIYFRGFKFFRFFAASLVVIHHTEQFKSIFGYDNVWTNPTIRYLGSKGVTMFFVLSGFLISYLLLKEKENAGTIRIRLFYMRRILRIWPLYFLVVLSSIFIFPHIEFFRMEASSIVAENFMQVLLLSLFILPNVTLFCYGAIPFSSQAWSIGVEEQFYLLWPLLIKFVERAFLVLIPLIMVLFVLQNVSVFVPKIMPGLHVSGNELERVAYFFRLFRIDCMAVGSLAAILVFNKHKIVYYLTRPVLSALVFVLSIGVLLSPVKIYIFDIQVQSVCFALLIINLAAAPLCFYRIENRVFNLFGDISYGIYMFHPLVCFTVIKLFGFSGNAVIYITVFAFTILLALMSYYLFEKRMLRLKARRFTVITSN